MTQMPLAEHDQMVKALAPERADQSFGMAVLPRRSRCGWSVANAHCAKAASECLAVDPITISNEVLRRTVPATCLGNLPDYPFGRRMCCDAEPKKSATIMVED